MIRPFLCVIREKELATKVFFAEEKKIFGFFKGMKVILFYELFRGLFFNCEEKAVYFVHFLGAFTFEK